MILGGPTERLSFPNFLVNLDLEKYSKQPCGPLILSRATLYFPKIKPMDFFLLVYFISAVFSAVFSAQKCQ